MSDETLFLVALGLLAWVLLWVFTARLADEVTHPDDAVSRFMIEKPLTWKILAVLWPLHLVAFIVWFFCAMFHEFAPDVGRWAVNLPKRLRNEWLPRPGKQHHDNGAYRSEP